MSERLSRLAPLTGVIFAGLSALSIAITPSSPNSHAGGATVIAFYQAHHRVERVSAIVSVFALTFLMFFAASLRSYLRGSQAAEGLAALVLPAAALLTVGLTTSAGFAYALADVPSHLAPATAQTLNLLDEDVFFAMIAGVGLFGIASGLAILRADRLPRPLGWAAIAIGVVAFTPAFGLALLTLSAWVLTAGILTYRRTRQPAAAENAFAAAVSAP